MEAPSPFTGAPEELDELELDDELAPDELEELEDTAPEELELELELGTITPEPELDEPAPEELELELDAAAPEELELELDDNSPDELDELELAAPELELLDDELLSSPGGITAPPHAINADDSVEITNARIAVERPLRNSSLDMNVHSSFLEAPATNRVGQFPCL